MFKSIQQAKAECNKLMQVSDVNECVKVYASQLEDIEKGIDIGEFKDTLADVISYKEEMSMKVSKRLFQLENDMRKKASERQELEFRIENLKKKKLSYPSDVTRVTEAIREEFHRIGRKPEPRILCELLEITDDTWRNAVEGSLASVVTSKNKYAKRYINMILGKVMMCNHYSELKNHKTAITRECMRYQNHVASAIKPEIFETPYIGKNAIRVQLEQANLQLSEIKKELDYQKKITDNLEELKRPLSWETETDIKYRVNVLTELKQLAEKIKRCRENIKTLDKNSGMIMKRIQLPHLKGILNLKQSL